MWTFLAVGYHPNNSKARERSSRADQERQGARVDFAPKRGPEEGRVSGSIRPRRFLEQDG